MADPEFIHIHPVASAKRETNWQRSIAHAKAARSGTGDDLLGDGPYRTLIAAQGLVGCTLSTSSAAAPTPHRGCGAPEARLGPDAQVFWFAIRSQLLTCSAVAWSR